MSSDNSPTVEKPKNSVHHRHHPGAVSEQTTAPGMSFWGWLTVALFVTSGLAMLVMLTLKWVSGGGPVWPWFTRYAYFAFPAGFICLLLALTQTLLRRRR